MDHLLDEFIEGSLEIQGPEGVTFADIIKSETVPHSNPSPKLKTIDNDS
jgi:hypothetical protein